jgi:hypothetical protein
MSITYGFIRRVQFGALVTRKVDVIVCAWLRLSDPVKLLRGPNRATASNNRPT